MPKQTNYNVGIYVRLSKDDERAGESLSIENQKLILTKYCAEQGWNIIDTYVDDGYSGTSFDRPAVQRLLEDAKTGIINLIIVKDLSRFGRNYIQVGQYIDYIFPTYNIRFIALNDNVDTLNVNSTAMDMMPIMNVFNEWHAANTSKKIRAVIEANCKAGKYRTTYAPYGYIKGDNPNRLPVIDPPAAAVVRRMFEMRAQGISPKHIAETFNSEGIKVPSDYLAERLGRPNHWVTNHLWSGVRIKTMLHNPTYLGHLAQMRTTTVSYKNHKTVKKDKSDWVIIENTHEPIVSQEIWDKCREMEASVSQGKKNRTGVVRNLSGLMYCADCGNKMRLNYNNTTNGSKKNPRKYFRHNYTCGSYSRSGKMACSSHYIKLKDIEAIVLADIRSMAELTVDEEAARRLFSSKKASLTSEQNAEEQKRLSDGRKRLEELKTLIRSVYEDKVIGKIPEEICVQMLEQYQKEQKSLEQQVQELSERMSAVRQDEQDIEEFIHRLKKYTDVQELTREMCLELIEYITVDEFVRYSSAPREIHIYYKLLDKPLKDRRNLFIDEA